MKSRKIWRDKVTKLTMNSDSSIVSRDSLLLPSEKYFFLTWAQCVLSLDVRAAISNSPSFTAKKITKQNYKLGMIIFNTKQ